MKSVVNKESAPLPKSEYPILKIHKELHTIVLFTSPKTGTVLNSDFHSIGTHMDYESGDSYWDEEEFIPFHGSVTISSED